MNYTSIFTRLDKAKSTPSHYRRELLIPVRPVASTQHRKDLLLTRKTRSRLPHVQSKLLVVRIITLHSLALYRLNTIVHSLKNLLRLFENTKVCIN